MTLRTTSGNAVTAEVQLLDVRQLAAILGMHSRSIWRLVALAEAGKGNFPKP